MYTQCQHCQVWFRIGANALRAGHGKVRCGCCGEVFDALLALRDEPPPVGPAPTGQEGTAAAAQARAPAPEEESILLEQPEMEPEPRLGEASLEAFDLEPGATVKEEAEGGLPAWALAEEEPVAGAQDPDAGVAAGDGGEAPAPEDAPRSTPGGEEETVLLEVPSGPASPPGSLEREGQAEEFPDFPEGELAAMPAREPADAGTPPWEIPEEAFRQQARRGWPLLWALGSLLLLLALLLQAAAYYRQQVEARFPRIAPLTERLCRYLPCLDQVQAGPGQVVVVARDVRSHPRFADTLLVNATLENRGETAIPYPVLELDIYDTAGRLVAARRFRPAEYLPPGMAPEDGMAPGVPVHVLLEVAGAGEEAVSFQFRFLPPDAPV